MEHANGRGYKRGINQKLSINTITSDEKNDFCKGASA